VTVLVVVPADELGAALTLLVFGGQWFTGVIRSILHRSEQEFGVWVVIGYSWSRERPEHAHFFQPTFQHSRTHGVAAISIEDSESSYHTIDFGDLCVVRWQQF
jgi:hypothetical protein